jgi:gamma-butyrobetaine dioxygenase
VEGGTSIFVDALFAAIRLRHYYRSDFNILTKIPIPFHYINAGNHLYEEHPTIELSNTHPHTKHIAFVNYSPPFQAPLRASTPIKFYTAFSRFSSMLENPDAAFQYSLREGDAVLFDNRRILHARTAFNDLPHTTEDAADTPNRWLKGLYLEADAVLNRRRILESQLTKY